MRIAFILVFLYRCTFAWAFSFISWNVYAYASDFPDPSSAICSTYRKGAVIQRKIPISERQDVNSRGSYSWKDIWYRPEYDYDPAIYDIPNAGIIQSSDLLFDINSATGQPLPLKYRRSANPRYDNFFTMLLSIDTHKLPLERLIDTISGVPATKSRDMDSIYRSIHKIGNTEFGMRRIKIDKFSDNIVNFMEGSDFYGSFDQENHLKTIMQCDLPGEQVVPHCEIYEKANYWEIHVIGVRRNEIQNIGNIMKHARNFAACLTWNGK